MAMLDRKLIRDLARMWAQVLTIALVMACGVATIIIAVGAYRSLEETRRAFYDRSRFADVFASASRAPLGLRQALSAIPGMSSLELRVVKPVLLNIEGMVEPATAIAVSIPDSGGSAVNRLYLRTGRLPDPLRGNEVAVVETFAAAHKFQTGDRFEANMNGRMRTLTISGIVLSPEYVYAIGPGDMVPDQRRFGVLFMPKTALDGIFDMDGAFNDLSATTLRNADRLAIFDRIDAILKPYGGVGAYGRDQQISHVFLDSELSQLRGMSNFIPPIFLFVAAFLVNMILSRLITLEREQIGLLKALGYDEFVIAWHYAKLTIVIALIGAVIGTLAGNWTGRALTRLYADFFSFPFLIFQQSLDLYAIAIGVTVLAALAGSAKAIWNVIQLPAAIAMQPAAPTQYRRFTSGGRRLLGWVSQLTIMAFRHLVRWPLRSAFTVIGVSFSVALLVTALFSGDSIEYMVDTVFFRTERQDATLVFGRDRSASTLSEVRALPGVLRAEPFRSTTAILRNGHHERRLAVSSGSTDADLARILDTELNPVEPAEAGMLVTERVASILHLAIGDKVEVELPEKNHRIERVAVTGIVQSLVGLGVYMKAEALDRLLADGSNISGARISIDTSKLRSLYRAVKETPAVASIAIQSISRKKFRETIEQNITYMMSVYTALSVIIAFGVIYNSARIQLSERARELASLRVLGFTNGEVFSVLLIELVIIVAIAQPMGWLLGMGFAWWVTQGFASDLFRVPFVINISTFAIASLVVMTAASLSALIVRWRVQRLDLVRVLKTRE
jgi:putative ABC transport system permease protein